MLKNPGTQQVYIGPGEAYFAREPALVQTLLGSCVAVTLHSRSHANGAICHALLPKRHESYEDCHHGPGGCTGKFSKDSLRFVDTAVQCMLKWFSLAGVPLYGIEAKVFGGSAFHGAGAGPSIGMKNAEAAIGLLEARGIRVAAADVGGTFGRKILFDTEAGAVHLKLLGAAHRSGYRTL